MLRITRQADYGLVLLTYLARERRTVREMVGIYCRGHHGEHDPWCAECSELVDYAMCRLDRCPFGEDKPTCAKCPIHCYKPHMRERIREVMRYAGPRMILHHPILAIRHKLDDRAAPPEPPRKRKTS